MATSIETGRDIALTIGAVNYDEQISSGIVTFQDATASVETLNGTVDYTVDNEKGTLDLVLFQDWGKTGSPASVCDALWDAADTAPTTTLAATVAINGKTITLTVLPKRPAFGGAAPDALTTTVSLPIRSISKA
jgi:hypothetical protein